jgi:hypothetical protein
MGSVTGITFWTVAKRFKKLRFTIEKLNVSAICG